MGGVATGGLSMAAGAGADDDIGAAEVPFLVTPPGPEEAGAPPGTARGDFICGCEAVCGEPDRPKNMVSGGASGRAPGRGP